MPSFDTVCEADVVEVKNGVENTAKEITTRFDFKGTSAAIEFKDKEITLFGDSDPAGRLTQTWYRSDAGLPGIPCPCGGYADKAELTREEVESVFGRAEPGSGTDSHPKSKTDAKANALQQAAAAHASAKVQQRLITFASTDPEFDEDSDPDGDLDL